MNKPSFIKDITRLLYPVVKFINRWIKGPRPTDCDYLNDATSKTMIDWPLKFKPISLANLKLRVFNDDFNDVLTPNTWSIFV